MTITAYRRRNIGPPAVDAETHLFALGDSVRLKGRIGGAPATNNYRITGTLPPVGGSPQYRIRNEEERHERVATQDSLEPVDAADGLDATLSERTFGHG
ncbi:hypothetical protein [Stappia stellulata]|uniref:hypothetical protein n=1 Tax=Stappia stellulata TaxID=71235 RepID=UPI0004902AF1|nr:hypothetical protein [Stappia stellulata]